MNTGEKSASKKISLSLTAKYANSWGTWEGVRELLQNWHDGLYDGNTSVDIVFREVRKDVKYEIFEAVSPNSEDSPVTLGFLIMDKLHNKLHLINRNTSLHKKILLLGFSKKSETANVIGQFGEGLKIGALALVREGRLVTMTTSEDVWHFHLSHDEQFDEKVLTVIVSERNSSADFEEDFPVVTEDGDTVTTVTLEYNEWLKYKFRFLFLHPPENQAKSEIGSLLLDTKYQGQLYVKGVWVSDLSGEDLVTGVNFVNLRIDRDRNAVPRPSEIDHMVSCMWVKALETKPHLAGHYLKLLQKETNRDVRQAVEYASVNFVNLIANEFSREYGQDAFAVDTSVSQLQLNQIRQELQKKVVICNETLFKLLKKSGRFKSLEEELSGIGSKERKLLPFLDLKPEEQSVVQHAVELVKLSHPTLSVHSVDIVDLPNLDTEGCIQNGGRFEVPSWMIKDLSIGHIKSCLQLELNQCMCRETRIACSLNFVLDSADSYFNLSETFNMIPSSCSHRLLGIMAPLSSQICKKAQQYFCGTLHSRPEGCTEPHSDCTEREKSLLNEIQQLREKLAEVATIQADSLKQLKDKLQEAEENAVTRELEYVNTEHQIQAKVQQRLNSVTKMYNEKLVIAERQKELVEEQLISQRREQEYWCEKAKEYSAQLSEMKSSMERQHDVFLEEMMHYVNLCKSRTETVQKLCTEQLGSESTDPESREKLELLLTLSSVISEELQKEKFLCMVCLSRRKEVVLVPCGHYTLCDDCTQEIQYSTKLCPICKTAITSTVKVYG